MTNYWNDRLFNRGTYMDALLNGVNEYQQSIQQLQDKLATEGCCISKLNTNFYSPNDIRYLSDVIRIFGDLGISYAEQHYAFDEVPTIKIEAYIDVKRPNTFTSNYAVQSMTPLYLKVDKAQV